MATIGPSRRRGAVSDLKALALKTQRRQAQVSGVLGTPGSGVGGAEVSAPETALLTCGEEGLLEGIWRQGGGVETGRQQGFDLGE